MNGPALLCVTDVESNPLEDQGSFATPEQVTRKTWTVRQLAADIGMEADDALIALWDAGWSDLEGGNSRIKSGQTNSARRALGFATRRELRTASHWQTILDLESPQFNELLISLGIVHHKGRERLPRKAVSRLRRVAKSRKINPETGASIQEPAHSEATPARSPFIDWRTIGQARGQVIWLKEPEVRDIHFELVRDYGNSSDPISPAGVRDEQILGAAVFRCQTALGSVFKYPTIQTSCAALLHALVQDHPFYNGNKRTGLVSMLVALDRNGLVPTCNEDQLFKLVIQIARHRIAPAPYGRNSDAEVAAIARWICRHSRPIQKGNRPLSFRQLRRVLSAHGCELRRGAGAKVTISRTKITRVGFFFGRKVENNLVSHLNYGGEGREVTPGVIKKVREELWLDEEHGVDAIAFYSKAYAEVSDFIAIYRKTLDRLAKR